MVQGLAIPDKPDNYVNDYANLLSYGATQELNNKLKQFQHETTNQIVVAIFPSLENESLEDFSTRLEQHWKIGQKGKDNGILLAIFVKEHQVRIEVGYGLEAYVPDALAGQIIQADIIPNFRTQHFDVGINSAVDALMLATKDAYAPTSHKRIDTGLQPFYPVLAILMLLTAAVFFVIMLRRWMKSDVPPTTSSTAISTHQAELSSETQPKPSSTGWQFFWAVLMAFFVTRGGNDRSGGDDDSFGGGGGGRSGGGGANGQW
jgi:uncharacterized protein